VVDQACASAAQIQAFLLGQMPQEQGDAVALHLACCPACNALADRLESVSDPLLHWLRRAQIPGQSTPPPSQAAQPTPVPDPPGAAAPGALNRVAGYEVLAELGRGGMSVVYLARQFQPARLVALKMLLGGGHAGAERRARFLAEADAIARLRHPGIVQVYEVGHHDGLPFLALEYVGGGNLAQRIAGLPQPPRQAAELVQALARAVQHAHEHGVIHRDLKPANVLLLRKDEGGRMKDEERKDHSDSSFILPPSSFVPMITDFGLARHERPELTATGAVLGTPAYMAPEQATGNAAAVGPSADVYALGAILYELLTGRPPFQGVTALETLEQARFQDPVPPSQLRAHLPRDLSTICLKCLQKSPPQRYASALELADDLQRFVDGRPIRARPVSAAERAWRWARGNPWPAGMAVSLAVLLVVLVVGSLAAAWRLNRVAGRSLRAEADATDRLFEALTTRASAGRSSRRPGQRLASMEALREAADLARAQGRGPDDLLRLRNEAIACLALPDLRLDREWEGNPPGTNGLAFDAAFRRYAWSFRDEGIRICRAEDHKELLRLKSAPSDRVSRWADLRFSPDGRFLAVFYRIWGHQRPLHVWELRPGVTQPLVALPEGAAQAEFAPDGLSVLAGLPGGAVARFDLRTGKETDRLAPGWPAGRLALSPDGRLLAVASVAKTGVQIRELPGGRVVRELPHHTGVQGLAWHPEGKLLASACENHRIYLWDAISGAQEGVLEGHRWEVHDLAFDRRGRYLLSFGWEMALRVWDVAGRRQVLVQEDVRVVSFGGEEGLQVAGLSGLQVHLWTLLPSDVHFILRHNGQKILPSECSPDSRWLATTTVARDIWLWDIERQHLARHVPGVDLWIWSARGDWVLARSSGKAERWPLRPLGLDGRDGVRAGPPAALPGVFPLQEYAWSWSGPGGNRVVCVGPERSTVHLLEVGQQLRQRWSAPMPNAFCAGASADGRWVAVGSFAGGNGILVWQADTGRQVNNLPIGDAHLTFSPDSRWLYTTTGRFSPRGAEVCAWRTDTWEPVHQTRLHRTTSSPALLAVVPDGTAVAVTITQEVLALLDVTSFVEIARFASPDPGLIIGLQFTPNGAWLIVNSSFAVHLWDLRRLRAELGDLGLDWDLPQPPPPIQGRRPLRFEVVAGEGK
jgi:WD40 repeat protein